MPRVFISYRRTDTAREAYVLKTLLESRLRSTLVFVDTEGIAPASSWPHRLEVELARSSVVLVLIGPDWRGPDDAPDALAHPDDWVRREVELGLEKGDGAVLPVIVENARDQLTDLPPSIAHLAHLQSVPLTSDRWVDDVRAITSWVASVTGAQDGYSGDSYPKPNEVKSLFPPLKRDEIDRLRNSGGLDGWVVQPSVADGEVADQGQELYKVFQFRNFKRAFNFMQCVAILAERYNHHPDWSNVWNRVWIRQRTWDGGHILTNLDFQMAASMNQAAAACNQLPSAVWPPADPVADAD